MIEQLLFIE